MGDPGSAIARHEMRFTLSTLAIGVAVLLLGAWLVNRGAVTVHWALPSASRFAVEASLLVVAFDVYFYALHRLFHTKWLYRRVHVTHHLSTTPSVRTAFAFHPVEGFLLLAFVPVAVWLVPMHLASILGASAFLTGTIVMAHCGREFFPDWWRRTPVLDWYVTPSVHARHHTHFACNYGATLSVFDKLFGTFASPETTRSRG